MFKKLREKITEEVQQTSLRLPASVQQSVQQLTQVDKTARPDICWTVCMTGRLSLVCVCERDVCARVLLSVLCVYVAMTQ